MINKKMETALNDQISKEAFSSYLYLSMASWCEIEGLAGCANFLYRHVEEEKEHMMKLFRYVNSVNGHALVPAVQKPPHDFTSIQKLFRQVYNHEKMITKSINELVGLCYKENDYTTLSFLQWYVEEQREEEDLVRTILDKIKLIGEGPQSLFLIDQELEKINGQLGQEQQDQLPF